VKEFFTHHRLLRFLAVMFICCVMPGPQPSQPEHPMPLGVLPRIPPFWSTLDYFYISCIIQKIIRCT